MRQLFVFVVLIALVAGGVWWFWLRKEPPESTSVPLPVGEGDAPAPREEGRELEPRKEAGKTEDAPTEDITVAPISEEPKVVTGSTTPPRKVLTTEERQIITGVGEWMAKRGAFVSNLQKLYASMNGAPIALEEDEKDFRAQYDDLHRATEALFIPEKHGEARAAVERIDVTIKEAVLMLSDPPLLEEVESAVKHVIPLTAEVNTINLLLNEIEYQMTEKGQ